jgi:hypothetical protein
MLATGGEVISKHFFGHTKNFSRFWTFFPKYEKKFQDIPKKSFRIYDIFPEMQKNVR